MDEMRRSAAEAPEFIGDAVRRAQRRSMHGGSPRCWTCEAARLEFCRDDPMGIWPDERGVPFEAELADRATDEPALVGRRYPRRFRGPRSTCCWLWRVSQKVHRSREDLGAGAGRAGISPSSSGRAAAPVGTRRRLSRDGGLARLPQVAPAAARAPSADGRLRRGRLGQCAGLAASAPGGVPRGFRSTDGPAAPAAHLFQRGDPEPIADHRASASYRAATLYDLLSAYAKQRSHVAFSQCSSRNAMSGRFRRRAKCLAAG